MQNFLFLLLLAGILIMAACKAKKAATNPASTPSESTLDIRLHDIWVLTTMNGEALDRNQPRPRLELYPHEGRMSGSGGCNELFGQIAGDGKKITFSSVGTTKMFCRDLMQIENNFLTQLQNVTRYQIKDLQLNLLAGRKEVLVFQKVD